MENVNEMALADLSVLERQGGDRFAVGRVQAVHDSASGAERFGCAPWRVAPYRLGAFGDCCGTKLSPYPWGLPSARLGVAEQAPPYSVVITKYRELWPTRASWPHGSIAIKSLALAALETIILDWHASCIKHFRVELFPAGVLCPRIELQAQPIGLGRSNRRWVRCRRRFGRCRERD